MRLIVSSVLVEEGSWRTSVAVSMSANASRYHKPLSTPARTRTSTFIFLPSSQYVDPSSGMEAERGRQRGR